MTSMKENLSTPKPFVCVKVHAHASPEAEGLCSEHFNLVTLQDIDEDESLARKVQGLVLRNDFLDDVIRVLPKLSSLKAITGYGNGNDAYRRLKEYGIPVANCPGSSTIATANFAMALLLSAARDLHNRIHLAMRTGGFNIKGIGHKEWPDDVAGSTLGIVGLGSIGTAIAKRAKVFDMTMLHHSRHRRASLEGELRVEYCSTLHQMLPRCDYVIIACPLTPETEQLFGAKEFEMMKPTATVINIARGRIIDHDALIRALKSGHIRGAALDVTSPEPLPVEHELFQLPNVIITPHCGGYSSGTLKVCWEMCMGNLKAALIDVNQMPHQIHE